MERAKLKLARYRAGLSQEALAERLGVTRNTVSQWERGIATPYPFYMQRLCEVLNVQDPADLDMQYQRMSPSLPPVKQDIIEEVSKEPEGQDMNPLRRQLLQQTFSVTSALAIVPSSILEQFAQVLATSAIVDEHRLFDLESQIALLWQYRDQRVLLPEELYFSAHRHVQHTTSLLKGSLPPGIRLRLLAIACQQLMLCGALFYDQGAYKQAREHYSLAIQAATQAEQPILQALASAWVSFTWTAEQCYHESAHQITQALSLLVDPDADRRTYAWISAVAAEIYAQLGNNDESRSLLDQAEVSLEKQSQQPQYFYLHQFSETQFNGFRGVCYQLLYDKKNSETVKLLEQARNALERALLDPSTSSRRKQLYRADLASSYARQGEVEMACNLAIQSVQGIDQATTKNVFRRLGEIQQLLQPWKETSLVKDLHTAFSTARIT